MSSGFRTECPECLSVFRLKDDSAVGKRMKCRKCGHAFRIQPATGDDFGGSFEEDDYGTGSAASPATRPAPVARRQPGRAGKKAKKRTRPDRPFPWKIAAAIVAVGVVIAVGVSGGYQAVTSTVTSIADSGLSGAFDSHEALMDESLENYEELEHALAAVKKEEDVPDALQTLAEIKQRTSEYDARLLALGEIDRQRATELTKYWNAGKDERKAAFDRVQTQIDRLKNADLLNQELAWDLNFFRSMDFEFDLVRELPEPDTSRPRSVYFYDRTRALRRALQAVSKVKSESSGTAQLEEIRSVTAEIEALKDKASQREFQRITSEVSSPYFAPHLAAVTTLDKLATKAAERAAGNQEVVAEIQKLSSTVSNLGFADMGVPGASGPGNQGPLAGGGPGGNNVSGGSGQPESTGSYPRMSVGNPPDGEERLRELRDQLAGGDPAASVVILRASGQGRLPLVPQVGRSFPGRLQGLQQHRTGDHEYVVARITGSLESIADTIRFGMVTGIDPEARLIAVDLSRQPQNTTPGPGGRPVAGTPGSTGPGAYRPGQRPPGAATASRPAGGSPGTAVDDRRASFAKQVGGAEKMVTINLSGGTNDKMQAFVASLREAKLTKAFSLRRSTVFLGWEESPQALADKIDFAEVVSVNEAERTLDVKLP
ncbi:MAG: hypothetical protein KDA79_05775 [Planctomycetaceae bacterium]|nr:hypothetical protein [Planctomycetaceae bacterium]